MSSSDHHRSPTAIITKVEEDVDGEKTEAGGTRHVTALELQDMRTCAPVLSFVLTQSLHVGVSGLQDTDNNKWEEASIFDHIEPTFSNV
jgi:hypothetical protein